LSCFLVCYRGPQILTFQRQLDVFTVNAIIITIDSMSYSTVVLTNASINDINNLTPNPKQYDGQMTGSQNGAAILATSSGQVTPLPFPAPGQLPGAWGPGFNGPILKSSQGNAINLNGDIAATATVEGNFVVNGALRAYLVYTVGQFGGFGERKFVDIHTPLTTIGYT
jgi:hypothetical protein